MPKTTVIVQLLAGSGEAVQPGYVRFRVPFRKPDSGTDGVVTPAPAPRQLDGNGRASITVDPGVWLVDEILPGYATTRAVLVPEATDAVNYRDLDEVDNPDYVDGFGPTWATQAKAAAAAAEIAAVAAELARAQTAGAIADGNVVLTVNGQQPDDEGNIEVDGGGTDLVTGAFGLKWLAAEDSANALALLADGGLGDGESPDPAVYVRTVNGLAPDPDGNVQLAIGSGSSAELLEPISNHYDPASPPADFGLALQAAVGPAPGRKVFLEERDGGYPMKADFLDVSVRLCGPGRILHTKAGPAIKVTHSIDLVGFPVTHGRALFSFFSSRSLEPHSYFTAPTSALQNVRAGDLLRYHTPDYFRQRSAPTTAAPAGDDTDAANLLAVGNSTTLKTFDGGWIRVFGFGLTVTGGPDVGNADATTAQAAKDAINNTTLTSSSGGSAVVASSGMTAAGFKVLVLSSLTGTFEPGDTLTSSNGSQAGTVSSRPYVIATGQLLTSPTNVTLHPKLNRDLFVDLDGLTSEADIDYTVDPSGVDSPTVPKSARTPTFDLVGVTRGRVDVHVLSTWGSGIRTRGCRDLSFGIDIDRAPNLADEALAAYGYGLNDGSEYSSVYRLNATAVRHAVTSMVTARALYPLEDPAFTTDRARMEAMLANGLCKFLHVENYDVRDPFGPGLDLHWGAYAARFGAGRVTYSGSLGRRETESGGLQDRGWGTTVAGLTVVGGTIGIKSLGHRFAAPRAYVSSYTDVSLNDHALHGVVVDGAAGLASDGVLAEGQTTAATFSGWLELDGVRTRGDLLSHTMGANSGRDYQAQAGIAILNADRVKLRLRRIVASGFNYAPLLVQGGQPERLFIDDFLQDFTSSPSGVSPMRFDSKPLNNPVIYNLRALKNPGFALSGMLRITAASMAFYHGLVRCLNDPAVPLLSPAVPNANATATAIAIDPAIPAGTGDTVDHSIYATTTQLAGKADLVGGKVPTSQLPSVALMDTYVVASEAAMLALTASQVQRGDLAVRTDGVGTFILSGTDPAVLSSWTRLNAPTDVVVSVNGKSGPVVLGKGDVGLGLVSNLAPADLPVSTATGQAITSAVAGVKPKWLPAYRTGAATAADAWEPRPTTDPTVVVDWIGLAPSPAANTSHTGTAGAYSNVDLRFVTDAPAPRPTA